MAALAAYLAIVAGGATLLYRQAPHTPYATDESGWVRNSIHIAGLLTAGDFRPMSWEFFDDASFGSMNPHVGKAGFVLTALALRSDFGGQLPAAPGRYLVGKSREDNIAQGRVVADRLLHPMRRATLLWGVLLLLAVMALAQAVGGFPAGCAAGILVAANPLYRELSTQAMTDVPYVFFLVLTALAGLWALKSKARAQAHRRFAIACVVAALASAVKLAAVILLTPYLFFVAVVLCACGVLRKWEAPLMLLESLVVFAFLAVILNPYIWPDFSQVSTQKLREEWRLLRHGEFVLQSGDSVPGWILTFHKKPLVEGLNTMEPQAHAAFRRALWEVNTRSSSPGRQEHPANVIPAIHGLTRPLQLPLLYLRWSAYKEFLFNATHWDNPTWRGGLSTLLGKAQSIPLEWLFAAGGLLWLARRAKASEAAIAFAAFVVMVTVIIALTRLADYERYLFPVLLLRTILAAMAIAAALRWMCSKFRPWGTEHPA